MDLRVLRSALPLALPLVLALVPTTSASAQMFRPHRALKDFTPLLGTWKGSGWAAQGEQKAPWKGTGSFREILGGHAILEEWSIDLGDAVPAPVEIHGYHYWSSQHRALRYVTLQNTGELSTGFESWTDGKLVSTSEARRSGKLSVGRSLVTLDGDVLTYALHDAMGTAPFQQTLEGTFRRSDAGAPLARHVALAPAPEEMAKLERLIGDWQVVSKVSPMAGVPPVEVSGREITESLFGGHAHLSSLRSNAESARVVYEAVALTAWSKEEKCWKHFMVDNMGNSEVSRAYTLGKKKIVFMSSTLEYGQPTTKRTVVEFTGEVGHRMTTDACTGAAPSRRSFEGTFTPHRGN